MQVHVTNLVCRANQETWEFHHLTDTHIDDPDYAHDRMLERIQHIRDTPNAIWFGGGDYGSLILPGDKRFGSGGHLKDDWAEHISRLPDYYLDRCEEVFGPIADKCVGLLAGNHEATVGRNYHRGLVAELANRFGNPSLYLGDRGWAVLRWQREGGTRRLSTKVYGFHGWSAGRLKGRKALQAERDLGSWNADIFCLGHDHQPYADLWWSQEVRGNKKGYYLVNKPRAFLNGGSWTHGQTPPATDADKVKWSKVSEMPGQSWVEGKNFRPQAPDNPYLEIHIDTGLGARISGNGRPAGVDFEIRWRGNRHYYGREEP